MIRLTIAISIVVLATDTPAQRGRRRSARHSRNSKAVREAFRKSVATVRNSTVRLLRDGRQVALGLVVSRDGLVVTKASELDASPICELVSGERLPARVESVDDGADLALLRIAKDLELPRWAQDASRLGAWLATAGTGELPVAIGVLSVPAHERRARRSRSGELGIRVERSSFRARVERVRPASAAAAAGLLSGDVIVRFDDSAIGSSNAFERVLSRSRAGQTVRLTVQRDDRELELEARLRRGMNRTGARSPQERFWGPLSKVRAGFSTVFQHDTVLRPEDCGGPVVDLEGRVVGLNIARAGRVETLAIPASVVRRWVTERLRETSATGTPAQSVAERDAWQRLTASRERLARAARLVESARTQWRRLRREGDDRSTGRARSILARAEASRDRAQEDVYAAEADWKRVRALKR